jgi:hypothetical protein
MNKSHYLSILKGAGIASGGALLTYALAQLPNENFGMYTPIVTALLSILINTGLKFLESKKTPDVTIDSLPQ